MWHFAWWCLRALFAHWQWLRAVFASNCRKYTWYSFLSLDITVSTRQSDTLDSTTSGLLLIKDTSIARVDDESRCVGVFDNIGRLLWIILLPGVFVRYMVVCCGIVQYLFALVESICCINFYDSKRQVSTRQTETF